jgi:hypothetical protein
MIAQLQIPQIKTLGKLKEPSIMEAADQDFCLQL